MIWVKKSYLGMKYYKMVRIFFSPEKYFLARCFKSFHLFNLFVLYLKFVKIFEIIWING